MKQSACLVLIFAMALAFLALAEPQVTPAPGPVFSPPGEAAGPAGADQGRAWRLANDFMAKQLFGSNYAARASAVSPVAGLPGVFDVEFRMLHPGGLGPSRAPGTVYQAGQEISYFGMVGLSKFGGYALQNSEVSPQAVHLPSTEATPDPGFQNGQRVSVRGLLQMRMIGSDEPGAQALSQPLYYMDTFKIVEGKEGMPKQPPESSLSAESGQAPHGFVRVDLSKGECRWMGDWGSDFLRKEIARIEAMCTPARGTTRQEVEAQFGPGKPTFDGKVTTEQPAPETSPIRRYTFGTNETLYVYYETDWKVRWAHFDDPYTPKGRPGFQAIPPEQEIRELRHRLKQVEHILAEYRARFGAGAALPHR